MKPRIDPEFQQLIPPLADAERQQLEANIVRDGCRDALITWRGVLLDGHHRLAICEQHGIVYTTREQPCDDRDAAKVWIIQHQFGRRNLPLYVRCELATQLRPLLAAQAHARMVSGRATPHPGIEVSQGEHSGQRGPKTDESLATLARVGYSTMQRAVWLVTNAPDDVKADLRAGRRSVSTAYQELHAKATPPPAPPVPVVASRAMTQADRQKRLDTIRALALDGWRSDQIAVQVGATVELCRALMRKAGIDCTGDRTSRGKRLDPNRIVANIVETAADIESDQNLIDFAKLDAARLPAWIESLTRSQSIMRAFINRLRQTQGEPYDRSRQETQNSRIEGSARSH
jgi:hypothetical protein